MAKMSNVLKVQLYALNQTPQQVTFAYKALNTAQRDVYVFNLLPVAVKGTVPRLDLNRTYTQIDGTTLVASKRLIEVPEDIDVLAPEVPWLTELSPGKTLEEKLTLSIPVREDFPYRQTHLENQPERRLTCKSLVFLLGFLMPSDPRWVRRVTIEDREIFATDYGFAIQGNLFASSETISISAECIRI